MQARDRSSFSLLSLPQLPLHAVIKYVNKEDKQALAATCRQLAALVSAASQDTRLVVTHSTHWQGLCKVLTSRTITCKTLHISDSTDCKHETAANSALNVLLRPAQITGCSFPGIQKVILCAGPLPCLLPPNIARCLPDLQELDLDCWREQFADDDDLQPLPYCSSLRKITYESGVGRMGPSLQWPNKYHTAEDLRRQLPNIVSLKLKPKIQGTASGSPPFLCMKAMLQAWGSQLTHLDILPLRLHSWMNLQSFTRLQSLKWRHCSPMMGDARRSPLKWFPSSLTSLSVYETIDKESDLKAILQLPALHTFSAPGFSNSLQQDWSHYPCTWQQVEIDSLPMLELPKLPLHSLKGQGCMNITTLELPNPLLPDSLSSVKRAAQCVGNANIQCRSLKFEGIEEWVVNDDQPGLDKQTAEVFLAASSAVQPCDHYKHVHIPQFPETEAAILRWLSTQVRELRIHLAKDVVQPRFWKAFQCSSNLEKVELELAHDSSFKGFIETVNTLVQQAAEHWVAVTGRPVKLVMEYIPCRADVKGLDDEVILPDEIINLKLELKQVVASSATIQSIVVDYRSLMISLQPAAPWGKQR